MSERKALFGRALRWAEGIVTGRPLMSITLASPTYRYTKGRCRYCGAPIHWRARACAAHRDLVIHDPLDTRYVLPKDGES